MSNSSAKLSHLEDAFRYLYQTKEHWPKLAAQLYCDCAIASLKAAGEKKLAYKLSEAAGLTNPNLFDKLWDELRERLDKFRSEESRSC